MNIAIIGAGNVGKALAIGFTRAGHSVTIASRDTEDAGTVAAATGARVASSNADAARRADIVVLAVWFASVADIAAEIADVVKGKTIVDVTNRISFGETGPDIDTTSSNGEEIAALFPDAHVVKAFNTLNAGNQADPIVKGIRLDGFVAGDDATAKASILDLAGSLGLDPIDVGPLVRSRQLEALAFLNMTLNITNNGDWQSGWKLVGAPATVPTASQT